MRLAHIGYQSAVGLYYLNERLYLARMVSTHLYDGDFVLLGEAQQGLWHTDVVVEIALRIEHVILLAEHCGYEFLGGRLAIGASDAYDGCAKGTTVLTCQLLQGGEYVIHHDIPVILGILCLVDDGIGATLVECCLSVCITIERVTLQGEEYASLGTVATVGSNYGMLYEFFI